MSTDEKLANDKTDDLAELEALWRSKLADTDLY